MKRIILMAIAACMMTLGAQAQQQKGNTEPQDVFDVVEDMPQYPGGMQAMLSFLQENITYPKDAQEKRFLVECSLPSLWRRTVPSVMWRR